MKGERTQKIFKSVIRCRDCGSICWKRFYNRKADGNGICCKKRLLKVEGNEMEFGFVTIPDVGIVIDLFDCGGEAVECAETIVTMQEMC